MVKQPTEQLKEEHKAIKLMLKILEPLCKKLESGEKVSPDDLDRIIEFIKVFADQYHHRKEEDLLFPAMEEIGIPREGGPIGVMLTEHNLGRDHVKGMSEAIGRYKAGVDEAIPKIVENARGYINLLTQHIDKEDNILYPMADVHISPDKQNELLEKFERVEKEIIGAGKHEEFHGILHNLEKIYLK